IAPESLAAAAIVRLIADVPSGTRITALVVQPAGAGFACALKRGMVIALSRVQLSPAQVPVSAPGKKTLNGPRGLAETVSAPIAMPGENVCICDQVCGRCKLT